MLAAFGVLQITAGIDKDRGTIIQPVRIITRGWFDGEHDRDLLETVTSNVRETIETALSEGDRDEASLNKVAQRAAGRLLGQKFRRQPVLMTAIVVL
jgi:mRNA degradation ribonuclease J1/J2